MDQINESSFLMTWKGAGSQGLVLGGSEDPSLAAGDPEPVHGAGVTCSQVFPGMHPGEIPAEVAGKGPLQPGWRRAGCSLRIAASLLAHLLTAAALLF